MIRRRILSVLLVAAALYILLFSFSHGFRWPSNYVLTNHVITYVYGFLPRAIVGTVGNLIIGDKWYFWKYPSAIIIATALVFVIWCIYEIIRNGFDFKNPALLTLFTIFAMSPFCRYYLHEMGYYEQYGYLMLVIIMLFFMKDRIADIYVIPCIAGFISLLVSESNAFLILPVTFVISALSLINQKKDMKSAEILKRLAILLATYIPHIIYILVVWFIKVPEDLVMKLQDHDRHMVNHVVDDAPNFEFREEVHPFYCGDRSNQTIWERKLRPIPLWCTAIIIVIIILTAYFLYKYNQDVKLTISYIAAGVLATLGAHSILIVGWDLDRFYFAIVMSTFFVSVFTLKKYLKPVNMDIYDICMILLALAAAMGIATHYLDLFDDAVYNESWKAFFDVIKAGGPE